MPSAANAFCKGGFVAHLWLSGCESWVTGRCLMPRMAQKRGSSLNRIGPRGRAAGLSVWLLWVLVFGGCQEKPVVESLPSANFNGPLQPVVVAPPAPEPVKAEPKFAEPKKAEPQLAAIPREWVPSLIKQGGWKWIVIHH